MGQPGEGSGLASGDPVTAAGSGTSGTSKVAALKDLDEGHQAFGIATGWLRGKLEVSDGH